MKWNLSRLRVLTLLAFVAFLIPELAQASNVTGSFVPVQNESFVNDTNFNAVNQTIPVFNLTNFASDTISSYRVNQTVIVGSNVTAGVYGLFYIANSSLSGVAAGATVQVIVWGKSGNVPNISTISKPFFIQNNTLQNPVENFTNFASDTISSYRVNLSINASGTYGAYRIFFIAIQNSTEGITNRTGASVIVNITNVVAPPPPIPTFNEVLCDATSGPQGPDACFPPTVKFNDPGVRIAVNCSGATSASALVTDRTGTRRLLNTLVNDTSSCPEQDGNIWCSNCVGNCFRFNSSFQWFVRGNCTNGAGIVNFSKNFTIDTGNWTLQDKNPSNASTVPNGTIQVHTYNFTCIGGECVTWNLTLASNQSNPIPIDFNVANASFVLNGTNADNPLINNTGNHFGLFINGTSFEINHSVNWTRGGFFHVFAYLNISNTTTVSVIQTRKIQLEVTIPSPSVNASTNATIGITASLLLNGSLRFRFSSSNTTNVQPLGQNITTASYIVCNNGTAPSTSLEARMNQTISANYSIWLSDNQTTARVNLTLTTTPAVLMPGATANGTCKLFYLFANVTGWSNYLPRLNHTAVNFNYTSS